MQLLRDGPDEIGPCDLEFRDPIVFQSAGHVGEVHAGGGELAEQASRVVDGGADGVAPEVSVVGHGQQGLLRHRVDDVARDELVDVHRVAVGRVLHARGGPQGPLEVGARLGQVGEAAAALEDVEEGAVGYAGVGHGGPAGELGASELAEEPVDLPVHAGDEEGGDRVDARQVQPGPAGLLQTGQVGLGDLDVALD